MNRNVQFNNPAMMSNALAAMHGNYSFVTPQFNFTPLCFNMPYTGGFGSYTNYGIGYGIGNYASSSTSASSSSEDSWEKKAIQEAEARKKRIEEAKENTRKALEDAKKTTVTFTGTQREAFVKYKNEKSRKEEIVAQGSFLGTVGFTSLFSMGSINRARKFKQNKPIKEMFFKYDNATSGAKYADLYEKAPIAMQNAQEEMVKAHQQYQKQLGKLNKKGSSTKNLIKDYKNLQKIMQDALNSGSPDEVAKATARIQAANGTKYKKLANGATKSFLAKAADVSKVTPTLGNKLKHHAGGKFGIAMSVIAPLSVLLTDMERIKNAFAEDTKTGMKQLGLSLFKGVASGATYFFADAFSKKFIAGALSKGAGKIAAKCAGKLATKGVGKIVGTALGSLIPIPGINLIAGALIGSVLDWGVRKLTACIINPGEKAKNNSLTNEELLTDVYMDKLNGVKLDKNLEEALINNSEFCANLEKQLQEQHLQEQLAQQHGQQLAVA